MRQKKPSFKLKFVLATALAVVVAVVGVLILQKSQTKSAARPVEQAEAEALFTKAVSIAQASDYDGLCSSVAEQASVCRWLLRSADIPGWKPGTSQPTVIGFSSNVAQFGTSPVSVLQVTGVRTDGTHYTSDFAVVRAGGDKGERVASLTPVFWSGVKYDASKPCGVDLPSGSSCGEATATISS